MCHQLLPCQLALSARPWQQIDVGCRVEGAYEYTRVPDNSTTTPLFPGMLFVDVHVKSTGVAQAPGPSQTTPGAAVSGNISVGVLDRLQ